MDALFLLFQKNPFLDALSFSLCVQCALCHPYNNQICLLIFRYICLLELEWNKNVKMAVLFSSGPMVLFLKFLRQGGTNKERTSKSPLSFPLLFQIKGSLFRKNTKTPLSSPHFSHFWLVSFAS